MRTLHVCISDRPGHTKQEYPLISIFQMKLCKMKILLAN